MITLGDVERAAQRIEGQVVRTPFLPSTTLSEITGANIWLKFENLQYTGSFKQRGALNKLLSLSPAERARGVIAVSAGNHAQGVAYHASQLGIPATIVMPLSTPAVKVTRTRAFGAEVILEGESLQQAAIAMQRIIEQRGLTLVHPYDDAAIIAGQGTVALEMLDTGQHMDAVVVSIGGGGLIAGMAVAFQGRDRSTEVVGVQSDRYPTMAKAVGQWSGGVPGGASMAEGIAVQDPGTLTLKVVRELVAHICVVPEARIEQAVALLLQIEKTLCEGAGAAGLAAVLAEPERFNGRRVGLVLCGGNIDNRLLVTILQRQLVREGRLLRFTVGLADRAGALGVLCTEIGKLGGNINTVTHDRTFLAADAKSVQVELEVEVVDAESGSRILSHLQSLGLRVVPGSA